MRWSPARAPTVPHLIPWRYRRSPHPRRTYQGLFRFVVRGEVKVVADHPLEQHVPDRAPHEIQLETGGPEAFAQLSGQGIDVDDRAHGAEHTRRLGCPRTAEAHTAVVCPAGRWVDTKGSPEVKEDDPMAETTKMSRAEAGRKGGLTTKQRHGNEFFGQIGRIGGKKGGETTKQRHGVEFYQRIGRKGGSK